MKLLVVIPSFYPAVKYGGPIFSSLNTCLELNEFKDIELSVSTSNANYNSKLDVETNKWIETKGLRVKYYDETITGIFSLAMIVGLWDDIEKADVIHIQGVFNLSSVVSLFFSYIKGKKIVFSPRGALGDWCLEERKYIKRIWLLFFLKPFKNRIVWHATSYQEELEIKKVLKAKNIKVIPNGINLNEYAKSPTKDKEFYQKYIGSLFSNQVFISMGRLHKKKGFDILIKAFEILSTSYPESCLLIAGEDDGDLKNLELLTKSLNLEKRVKFIGQIDGSDKLNFLANADIFMLASHNENFGNVYLESLASGTPIIATKNTPWEDVAKFNCGYHVNNNPQDIADAAIKLLKEDETTISKNSRIFSENFTWKKVAQNFYKVFYGLK